MARNAFDAILTSAPLNATAAKVTARGEQAWVPEKQRPPGYLYWTAPPALKPFYPSTNPHSGSEIDISGRKFGRFTVIGLLGEKGGKDRGDRWVCRCVCGDYEARSVGAIAQVIAGFQGAESIVAQCWNCAQLKISQHRYKTKGSKPISAFINAKPRVVMLDQVNKPENIIAAKLSQIVPNEDDAKTLAIEVIADLNRSDFRVVRAPAGSTTLSNISEVSQPND
jgi:hypothetical protein